MPASTLVKLVLLSLGSANSCSLAPPSGWRVAAVARDSDQGLLPEGQVRLELREYKGNGDYDVARSVQGVYDFAAAALVEHDATMEFMPYTTGYISDTAIGSVIASPGGLANVSWGPQGIRSGGQGTTGSAEFSLGATVASALWWYSPSLDRVLSVYQTSSNTLGVAACSNATGVCKLSAAPADLASTGLDWSQSEGAIRSWDSQRLVALPLMCCVCTSSVHFTYTLDVSGLLSLQIVPTLNSIAAVAYDPARSEVWQAEGETGQGGILTITRYDYAQHQATSATLSSAQIIAVFGSRGGLPTWAIALIIVMSLLGLFAISALALWQFRRTRRQKQNAPKLDAMPKASADVSATAEAL